MFTFKCFNLHLLKTYPKVCNPCKPSALSLIQAIEYCFLCTHRGPSFVPISTLKHLSSPLLSYDERGKQRSFNGKFIVEAAAGIRSAVKKALATAPLYCPFVWEINDVRLFVGAIGYFADCFDSKYALKKRHVCYASLTLWCCPLKYIMTKAGHLLTQCRKLISWWNFLII